MISRKTRLYFAILCAAALLLSACGAPAEKSASGSLPENSSSVSEADVSASAPQVPSPEDSSAAASDETVPASSEDSSGEAAAPPEVPAEAPAAETAPEAVPPSGTDAPSDKPAADSEPTAVKASSPVAGSVSAQAAATDLSYFDDAAFIGNSLVEGFRLYSGVKNCDYYSGTSMTIFGVGDYISQMSSKEYGKIYMLLGINEIGYNKDKLISAYSKVLDRLINDHPDALIYIMGVSPVTAKKEASSDVFTMDNIRAYNERLLQLAQDKNCCYIDLCDALAGEDGYLPADVSRDGVHFVAAEYKVWRDYLLLHYVPAEPQTEPSEEPPAESAPAEEPDTTEFKNP